MPYKDIKVRRQYLHSYYRQNKDKMLSQNKTYQQLHPEKVWKANIKNRYGITEVQYNEMLQLQNGVCAICKTNSNTSRRFDVDHEHDTGKVRGLLCNNCNQALGRFNDSVEILDSAVTYLEKHRGRS